MTGKLVSVTIVVGDLAHSQQAYETHLGYKTQDSGTVSAQEAAHWNAEKMAGAPYALLAAESGNGGRLRLVECKAYPQYNGLTSYGWNAVELLATDPESLAQRLEDSPFDIIGPPRVLTSGTGILAMQVRGPSGEVVYMTRLNDPQYQKTYGVADTFVDRPFILVVAGPDLSELEAFYGKHSGSEIIPFGQTTIGVVSTALGVKDDTLYPLSLARFPGQFSVELDGYPKGLAPRPQEPNMLPAGIAMISITASDLDAPGLVWETAPTLLPGPHYQDRRAGITKGPAGELIEFIEDSA